METNIDNHMKALVQFSIIDGQFADREKSFVYAIGKANNLSEERIDEIVKNILNSKEFTEISYEGLLSDERFAYLYDIIQLMKIDGEVFLSEVRYCEGIAEKLGYHKKVVKNLASRVYSDPAIAANRDVLVKEAEKYRKY